ncbi:tyrosine-type recombinase/integrase [Ilumatobacter sp.]|uniref:tyrosine-type recombinase/integrase n=1 Tax=Ilumatobacter sp. TaxID=1967498 RepID=UPI003C6ED128
MRAAADQDPLRRWVVEMLARTALRVGEFCELTADAVVFMNGRHWLRVPIGKLHNDSYVPLHPQLVERLDHHQSNRSDDLDRLVVFDGRRLDRHMVARMVRRVAKAAGIGRVHPHQLRHRLETQAINRGMSLEAIAAMLGHNVADDARLRAHLSERFHAFTRSCRDVHSDVTDRQPIVDVASPSLVVSPNASNGEPTAWTCTAFESRLLTTPATSVECSSHSANSL